METSRRSFLMGSLGAVALGVAGCSSSGGGGNGTTSRAPGSGGAAPSGVKGDITVWDFGTEALAKYEDPLFTAAYPGIKINHVVQPAPDYNKLLQAALHTSDGPDAVLLHAGTDVSSFSPALVDLASMITSEQRTNLVGWDGMSPDGDASKGIFGLPFQLSGGNFFYNKRLFSKAGLDPEKPPASIPEFTAACAQLKSKGITPIAAGDKENATAQFYFGEFQPATFTADEAGALATGAMKWVEDKPKAVFQTYLDLARGNNFEKSWRTDSLFKEQVDLFSSGKAAINFTLNNYLGIYYTALKNDVGVITALAAQPGGKVNFINASAGLAWCVAKRSKNRDAAFAWCSWKVSRASQERDLAALSSKDDMQNGRLPTDKRVTPAANAYPAVKQAVAQLKEAPLGTGTLSSPKINAAVVTQIQQAFGGVIDGRQSLHDFLGSLDKAQHS